MLAFETPSSTGLWTQHAFDPDTFEIVTETLEVKLAAMACYETEVPPWPHPRSLESLRREIEHAYAGESRRMRVIVFDIVPPIEKPRPSWNSACPSQPRLRTAPTFCRCVTEAKL